MENVNGDAGDAISNVFVVIQRMKHVLDEEENHEILQTDSTPLENILLNITTIFRDQQEVAEEPLKIWLQLLHNSLTEANSILHRYNPPPRQRCLDYLMCKPGRLSKQVNEWKVHFNYLFQGLQRDFSIFISGREAVIAPVITPVIPLIKDVIEEEEILQTELRPVENLLLDISAVFQDQQKAGPEALKIWLEQLHNSLTEANSILHRYGRPSQRQRRLDCLMGYPGRTPKELKEWKVHINYLFQGLQRDFSIFVTAPQIIHKNPMQLKSAQESIVGQSLSTGEAEESGHTLSTGEAADSGQPLSAGEAEESGQPRSAGEAEESESALSTGEAEESKSPESKAEELGQPLSKYEAWMLFRRIAFKENPASQDIEEYARNIADECKGLPLAITLVAAAMMGKTTVDEWRTSLSSIKNADPSSPDTELHSSFDPKPLYQRLITWSYDALPNSNVKNCFLYCAMYKEKELIYVEELVQMWVAEGLVRSRQGSHLMDMAIGFSYVNLLVDRCFFQNASFEPLDRVTFRRYYLLPHPLQLVKVHDVIRSMAIYIGEEKENCVLKDGQELKEFPEIHNENCKRISVQRNYIENLPTEFICPKLVSLFLTTTHIRKVPSEFLASLTSLKVLVLVGTKTGRALSSIPSSVGQLKQLEFLDLRGLEIKDLPEDICHLSALQFLDLSYCKLLQSLPSQIGELKNLKYLNLERCDTLRVIPHEISQLTSLNTLSTSHSALSLEAESEASIWSLKGLGNLTTLSTALQQGTTSSGIREGIMGTWLEMRHFCFYLNGHKGLPRDMQNMRKLQSFIMFQYHGLSLPDYTYKFHHLEYLQLWECPHLRELSPLKRLPNLKYFKLGECSNLKELGIGNSGRASGFLMLKLLAIVNLPKLESIAGPSNHGEWNDETILPNLCVLAIQECPRLKRLPKGMEKLVHLSSIFGEEYWWQRIIWEDDNMKSSLQKLFKKWTRDWVWHRFQWDIFRRMIIVNRKA